MAHFMQHHVVPVLTPQYPLGLGTQFSVEVRCSDSLDPPRVWETTSAPVSLASIWDIWLVGIKLLLNMRVRMINLVFP